MHELHTSGSITIGWQAPELEGGWPITSYDIWVDDGSGVWPDTPTTVAISEFADTSYLTHEVTGLTDSVIYGFKVQATNDIGTSVESNTQYFVCAGVPTAASTAPIREASTETSLTISWSVPDSDGGSPVTGYRVYMNPLDDGDWTLIYDGQGQPTVLTFEVLNLKRGMYYRFISAAINQVGEGANSTDS